MDSIRVLYVEGDPADQEATHRHLVRHAPTSSSPSWRRWPRRSSASRSATWMCCSRTIASSDGTGLDLLDAVRVARARSAGGPRHRRGRRRHHGPAAQGRRHRLSGEASGVSRPPCRSCSRARTAGFCTATERRHAPIRVLYAEHHPEDMALTLRAFEGTTGARARQTVTRARDALAKLKTVHYDVLLLDNRMPDLSGIEVLRSCRPSASASRSSWSPGRRRGLGGQAFKLGVADYLIKREGYLAKLPSTIENVLAHRRSGRREGRSHRPQRSGEVARHDQGPRRGAAPGRERGPRADQGGGERAVALRDRRAVAGGVGRHRGPRGQSRSGSR